MTGEACIVSDVGTASRERRTVAQSVLREGDVVDRFRVVGVLGVGGHGVVYTAEHVQLGYRVALKVMERRAGLDPARRARFRREALVGAALRHRNVVGILEAGDLEDGSPYLVMEYVEGIELAKVISHDCLSAAAVVDLGTQLLAAITALAAHGIVHRDIKPQNIMLHRAVDDSVQVKLLDFGICKALHERDAMLTQDGFVLGTPHYMSPEQIRGEPLDVRSDLFAVGTVLYEAITGVSPAEGSSSEAVLTKVLLDPPAPIDTLRADFAPAVASIVERALVKDRDSRWMSPSAMADALCAAARDLDLSRGGDAWKCAEILSRPPRSARRPRARAPRLPLRVVKNLSSPAVAARMMPTPAACPSALRLRREKPKYAPPWWPAAATALVAGIVVAILLALGSTA
jgi:serine/threonine protein kinase